MDKYSSEQTTLYNKWQPHSIHDVLLNLDEICSCNNDLQVSNKTFPLSTQYVH